MLCWKNIEKKYRADGITVETKVISEEGSGSKHACMQNMIAKGDFGWKL